MGPDDGLCLSPQHEVTSMRIQSNQSPAFIFWPETLMLMGIIRIMNMTAPRPTYFVNGLNGDADPMIFPFARKMSRRNSRTHTAAAVSHTA